jgi:hypothetical protein
VEEFGASGLAWRRIVEGIIVEKLWKHLVNDAPGLELTIANFCTTKKIKKKCKNSPKNIKISHNLPTAIIVMFFDDAETAIIGNNIFQYFDLGISISIYQNQKFDMPIFQLVYML